MQAGRISSLSVAAALFVGSTRSAAAQVFDTKVISLEGAKAMAGSALAEAQKNNWTVAIAIVDLSGGLILFQRMDEVQAGSLDIAIAKARTAARFKRPTKALADALAGGRLGLLSVEGVVVLEGGVPVTVNGKIIGAIGVSGMTSEQDAIVAKAGADALKP